MTTKMNEDTRVKMAVYGQKIEAIMQAIADYYKIPVSEIGTRKRVPGIVKARRRVSFYVKEYIVNCPLGLVGYMINKKYPFDHASIISYNKKHRQEMNLKRRDGSYVYPELQLEDFKIRALIEKSLHNYKCGNWLEDFSVSSGNFLN